jgi:hypothetical protein
MKYNSTKFTFNCCSHAVNNDLFVIGSEMWYGDRYHKPTNLQTCKPTYILLKNNKCSPPVNICSFSTLNRSTTMYIYIYIYMHYTTVPVVIFGLFAIKSRKHGSRICVMSVCASIRNTSRTCEHRISVKRVSPQNGVCVCVCLCICVSTNFDSVHQSASADNSA